jgi:glycosyltransferase involved in cell wall biosynthesis
MTQPGAVRLMQVAILIPVLGRPHRIIPTINSVAAATPEPHRLLFLASDDDQPTIAALEAVGADFMIVAPGRGSWACKINDGYRATTEPWIFTGADDLAFHPGWFSRALAWADDTTGVIGTNDIANPRVMTGQHSTHSLIRRSYVDDLGTVDGPGQVMHEGYAHQYADDEAVATAMARGTYAHAFDSIVEHLHPMVGKAPDDATYRLGRERTRESRRLFLARRRLWMSTAKPTHRPASARTVVVTACYGGVDTVLRRQAPQDIPVDWICFTDQADLSAPAPWRVVHSPARFDHPCLAAKVHKATPSVDATDVVWIDASMEVTSRTFVRQALAARHDGIAVFAHPRRQCIYREAAASLGSEGQGGKYAAEPLLDQVAAYRAEGHPEQAGLYACGVVAWDLANPIAVELGRLWLAECERWSWQDQLSFPVVCRRLGVTPGVFPIRQIERSGRGYLANRWLRIHSHSYQAVPA